MREKIKDFKETAKREVKTDVGTVLASAVIMSIVMIIFGMTFFGWLVFPVEWKPNGMNDIPYESKEAYVTILSEWYAITKNDGAAQYYIKQMYDIDDVACNLAREENSDMIRKARFIKIAYMTNGVACE